MISYGQAIVLGLLQGVSELFPISSLGHSVILPTMFGWDIHQNDPCFLTFLVATHLATALVLLGFFWQDWVRIVRGLGRSLARREIAADDVDAKLGWLLIVGTIPAGLHRAAAAGFPAEGLRVAAVRRVLPDAERLPARAAPSGCAAALPTVPEDEEADSDARISETVGFKGALGVGAAQALALVPGFSRSGATMAGGLLVGLNERGCGAFRVPARDADHRRRRGAQAARAARLRRATACVVPRSWARSARRSPRTSRCASSLRFFQTNSLKPFAIYCVVAGAAASIWLAFFA